MSSTRPLPLEAVLIRWLQLIQTFGLPTVLPLGAGAELVVLCYEFAIADFRIETHSLPSSFAASHRGFAFCLADPIGSAADFKKAR